jgi:DNA modification methylase
MNPVANVSQTLLEDGSEEEGLDMKSVNDVISKYEDSKCSLISVNKYLDRRLVSFQANKNKPLYRLFKYKEGFSASLVDYFIDYTGVKGVVLDPFSGTGTTSIVAGSRGINTTGVELLPVGDLVAKTRSLFLCGVPDTVKQEIFLWSKKNPWKTCNSPEELITMRITDGAYPAQTEWEIRQFLTVLKGFSEKAQLILKFSLCSILESVSYTRKDGQYLRWDYRSGRSAGKNPFNKGVILEFDDAINCKLSDVLDDLNLAVTHDLFSSLQAESVCAPEFVLGSSLIELMKLSDCSFSSVITSPPYCNRYDYTRTYALELAALGVGSETLTQMRQTMLSCTVENRAKNLLEMNFAWKGVVEYTCNHPVLSLISTYLWDLRSSGKINNNGIPRMVEGYFTEMACIIYECSRLLKSGGSVVMVNDNVRYAGVAIPVDMILSDIAQFCGMCVDKIMVLPQGKGNSSQQMGAHGRNALRKCVYVWRKK